MLLKSDGCSIESTFYEGKMVVPELKLGSSYSEAVIQIKYPLQTYISLIKL
jgi:hypothetical protein